MTDKEVIGLCREAYMENPIKDLARLLHAEGIDEPEIADILWAEHSLPDTFKNTLRNYVRDLDRKYRAQR